METGIVLPVHLLLKVIEFFRMRIHPVFNALIEVIKFLLVQILFYSNNLYCKDYQLLAKIITFVVSTTIIMGLCIYYSGQIKNAESLPLLIDEVKDVCSVYNWKFHIHASSFPGNTLAEQEYLEPIYGISFTPPQCETIGLTFLSNGVMVCPSRLTFFGNSRNETQRNYIYQIHSKTQYAGFAIHAIIINFFRYLNDKYLTNFKMIDESLYWETGDEDVLRKNFKAYDALLDNFTLSLETFPVKEGEGMISYFERLLEHLNRLKRP